MDTRSGHSVEGVPAFAAEHLPKARRRLAANFNRCGGKRTNNSANLPGTEKMPQFHSPRDFGFVRFSAEKMPF
jgi:hypothetical protein